MTKMLDFKRCKAFVAMLLVLCQLFSIFGVAMPFTLDNAKAYLGSDEYCIKVRVHKLDAETKEYLPEAKLKVADADESSTRASWDSTDTYYEIEVPITEYGGWTEETNISHDSWFVYELNAPEGYELAEPVVIKTSDIDCLKNYTFLQNQNFEKGTPEYEANLANREAFYNAIENGEIPPSGELVIDVYVYNHKKTINNPTDKNNEPNKPLSTDDEVVNKGEDIEVTFENQIYTVQNLTVSKVLKEELLDGNFGESLSEAEFNFKAYFSNMKEGDTFTATKSSDPDAIGAITADANGEAEFSFNLKNKESIVFNEMPVNVQYQIEEILEIDNQDGTLDMDYEPAYLVSGLNTVSHTATGNRGENLITGVETLEARESGSVIFTNTKVMDYGKLEIVKKVEGTPANPDEVFQFTVNLDGDLIVEAPMKFKAVKTVGEDATVEETSVEFINKEATVELKAGESIEITLPAGTTYKVIEAENDAYDVTYEVEELGAGPGENVGPGGASTYAGDYNELVKTTYNLKVYKVDQDMNPVKDATLQLIKKDSNAVETQWVSTNEPHLAFSGEYEVHSTYFAENILEILDGEFDFTLKETNTPSGYKTASDIDLSYERLLLWQFYDRAYEIDEEMSTKLGMEVEKVSDGIYFNQTFDENYNSIDTFIVFMVDESEENIDSGDTPEPDAPSKHEKAEGFIAPDSHSKVTVTNTYKSGKLVVTKEVVGNDGVQTSFKFNIKLSGPEISEGEQYFNGIRFFNGEGSIYLKSGESKEFDLPDGTTYKVEETQYESYSASYSEEVIDPNANINTVAGGDHNNDGMIWDVVVHKVDENGDPVVGAKLQMITDDGVIIDEWISDGTPYETYFVTGGNELGSFGVGIPEDALVYIHEVAAPEGYELAEDISFFDCDSFEVTMVDKKIPESGEGEIPTPDDSNTPPNPPTTLKYLEGNIEQNIYKVVKVTNTYIPTEDEVAILKVDSDNNPLAGATLQIIDADGNVVDEWVSTNEEHRISLVYGTYTLHEAKAPRGYRLAEDIEFTVAEGSYNTVIMVDPPISVMVSTGGTGTMITIALAIVFGCATGFLVYMGKKKEKEEAQTSENSDNKETKTE